MQRNWLRLKAATAWFTTFALLGAAQGMVRAQVKPDDNGSAKQEEKQSTKHRSRKGAYILTFVGAGLIGAGAYQVIRRPSGKCTLEEAFPTPGTVRLCPIDFDSTGRKTTGALLLGFGALMTVGGLLWMRHPEETPASQPQKGSAALSSPASLRFSGERGGDSGTQLGASSTFDIGDFLGANAKYQIGIPQARPFVLRTPDLTATPRADSH